MALAGPAGSKPEEVRLKVFPAAGDARFTALEQPHARRR